MTLIGTREPMLDGLAKATGRLRYAADLRIEGLAHALLLTSPHPHARILSLDATAALTAPGVLGVFWHGNMPAHRYNSSIWFEGQEADADEQMFPATVRHIGDRVAVVVAESLPQAEAARDLVQVSYDPLEPCLTPEAADRMRGPLFDAAGAPTFLNPVAERDFALGDVAAGFAAAAHVTETTVRTPKTHHSAIETHVAIALPEPGGRVCVMAPCQSVHAVQVVVARALGLAAAEVHVIKTPIGGSFGGKAEPVLEPIAAELARRLDRPVRLACDRQQTFTSTRMRSATTTRIRSALSAEGRILARETETLIDVGAYVTGGNYLPGSMLQRHVRLYAIPAETYSGRAVYTNTPPTGAFRGYGSPQINAAGEIHLDIAARRAGLDPVALRLLNAVTPNATEPYTGLCVGNARLADCLREGAAAFRWAGRSARPRDTGRLRRGVGMAAAAHVNGCFPGSDEQTTMTMALGPDGRITMVSALHDLGCGSNTTLAQIAAEVLGLAPAALCITEADTDLCGYDLGTRASRMTYVQGEATRLTALALADRIRGAAGRLANVAPEDLMLAGGGIRNRETGRFTSLAALAADLAHAGLDLPTATVTHAATANPSSHAAHFAEVEVDSLTGLVRVTDYLAAHDIGRAINPMLVEGQIHGGVQIGIGYALFEDVANDRLTGRMGGHSFARYIMANSLEMPPITVRLVEAGEPSGPFGAKAVGEIATIPVAAAVVNAVNAALGTELTDLPLLPARILDALHPA
ncbi:xanthine dehydrogenase family protein molybdopterin-binding subunit [Tabrizicola soli]|uniref:Xanthine dehydrogenase family protein molybdopterin-binding subunit n=1 Tax=Tabrizicola soli TaxID=2185115 RepID=A0ABV7DY51_9RHOB|nr:xanthine dehydrogenase family protein molybdopterin-binding subunit [Tabrizicola soli]